MGYSLTCPILELACKSTDIRLQIFCKMINPSYLHIWEDRNQFIIRDVVFLFFSLYCKTKHQNIRKNPKTHKMGNNEVYSPSKMKNSNVTKPAKI